MRVVVDVLFHPDEITKTTFDSSDAVDFWDLVNRRAGPRASACSRGQARGPSTRATTLPWRP